MGGRKASLAAPWIVLFAAFLGLWVVAAWFRVEGSGYPRVVLFACAAAWLVSAVRLRARQWRVDDVPTSECANVAIGFAEVSGRARLDPPLAARGSATPCAYYRWELQQLRTSGKNTRWVTVESDDRRVPFRVVDATGEVWVDPRNAELMGLDAHTSRVPGRSGSWRQVERRIDIDEPVYVLGPTRLRADSAVVEFGTDDSSDEFIVSDDSERKVRNRVSFAAWASSVLGALASGLALIVRAEPTFDSDGDPSVAYHFVDTWARVWRFGVVSMLVFVGLLVFSWLFRAYNRLVRVRAQAERAWSLIEIELQRRHDLVGQLVAVVRAYASYEQETQVALAAARGSLPDAERLGDAAAADEQARGATRSLVALAEGYPDLRASEQYRSLQAALVTSEDRVAAARRFFNDAVTVTRDRRQVLPGSLVARFVTWPALDLFEPGADERAPVAVSGLGGSPPPPPPPPPAPPG